jgi:hypothetical protein
METHCGNDPNTKGEILAPHVVWDFKHVEVTATEAMEAEGNRTKPSAQREAEEFLRSKLAHGPVAKEEILEEAEAHDIAPEKHALRFMDVVLGLDKQSGVFVLRIVDHDVGVSSRGRISQTVCNPKHGIGHILLLVEVHDSDDRNLLFTLAARMKRRDST